MAIFNSIISTIFLAFLAFGIFSVLQEDAVEVDLKERLMEQVKEQPVFSVLFIKSLDELTPSLNIPVEQRIFLITDFPVFSFFHLIIAIIFVFIGGVIMRMMKVRKFKMLIVFLLLILLAYIIGSVILILIYNISAVEIGFSSSEAKDFRIQYENQFNDVLTPLLVFAAFTLLIVFRSVIGQMMKK